MAWPGYSRERDVRSETGPYVREGTATELVSLCFRGCLAVRRDPSGFTPTAGIEDTLGPGERMRIALRTHLRIVTSAGLGDHGAATDLHGHRTARRHPVELVFHRRYAAKAIRRLRPLLGLGRFYERIFVRVIISTFLMAGLIAFSASAQETKNEAGFLLGS